MLIDYYVPAVWWMDFDKQFLSKMKYSVKLGDEHQCSFESLIL
jgi:hypothetical protein